MDIGGTSGGVMQVENPSLSKFNFEISSTLQDVIVSPGGTSSAVVSDVNVTRNTGASKDPLYSINITPGPDTGGQFKQVSLSLAGSSGSISGNSVSRVSDGSVEVYATTPWLTKKITLSTNRTVGTVVDVFSSYVSGTLGGSIYNSTLSRATGQRDIFSTQNHSAGSYSRNNSLWMSGVDITGASPWNSAAGPYLRCAAITPIHVACAAHAQTPVGSVVRFIANDNTIVERTVVSTTNAVSDVQIAKLDSDLPSTIKPFKIFPSNLASYLPTIGSYNVPIVILNQFARAAIIGLHTINYYSSMNYHGMFYWQFRSGPFSSLSENIVGGDSGSPIVAIVGSEAVLLCSVHGGNGSPNYAAWGTQIDNAVASLGGGHSVQRFDLSGYQSF